MFGPVAYPDPESPSGWRLVSIWIPVLGIVGAFILILLLSSFALPQHNHAQYHPHYQNWVNRNGEGCCNDQDCGELPDNDERTVRGQLEVRVEGEWCPVLPKHYLRSGNVPNASVAHVCVWDQRAQPRMSPCERLLCYQPKPLS